MQDIMDEALAMRLYEEDCRAFEQELNAAHVSANAFAHMQQSRDARNRDAQLLGAHSFADYEDYEEYYEEAAEAEPRDHAGAATAAGVSPPAATPSSAKPAAAMAATAASVGKKAIDRSLPVNDAGKGFNSIRESMRKQHKSEKNGLSGGRVEAEKHATRSDVLDEHTQLILQKLINRGELDAVHGAVRGGKEARVYFAVGTDERTMRERQLAVKVFKTTLNAFSNRHEYVTGDRRHDLHFAKKSQRRQLQAWTEREFRNLSRAVKHVRAPQPLAFKEHVIVMDFVGENGYPAPTLKDAALTPAQLGHAYADVLQAVRTLTQDAHLVHGDLSEYNILFFQHKCWLIDFGQAADRSHPNYHAFLKRDLANVHTFFERAGLPDASADSVGLLAPDAAFEFVTSKKPLHTLAAFPALRKLLDEKRRSQPQP